MDTPCVAGVMVRRMTGTRGEAIASARDRPAGGVTGTRKAPGPRHGSQRPTRAVGGSVGSSIATEQEVAGAGVLGEVQRDRVIRAEHSAAALQGVPAQSARRLQLAHL